MTRLAMICGCAGTRLSSWETDFFRETRPAGFILFSRNCQTPDQIRALTGAFLDCVQHDALVLIDQEGGRVQRLPPPQWPAYPPGAAIGRIYDRNKALGLEAARLDARLIGDDLAGLGINMDCLPVLDLAVSSGHEIIGERAYHGDPEAVARLGRAAADGLMAAGVLPVVKHIPGHGRANADSHESLPTVEVSRETLESTDFMPFRALNDMPAAMTAHILYTDIDAVRPATTSAAIIGEVIRGFMGFDGLLMSDDVSMGALRGTIATRVDALFEAGCDLALHCNGEMAEMEDLARHTPQLAGKRKTRFDNAMARIAPAGPIDRDQAWQRLQALLATVNG